jgi:signal transduction histidine kinase
MHKKLCTRIIQDVDRTDQMLQDLLDTSRIKAGEIYPIRTSFFDLDQSIHATLEDLSTVYGSRFVYRSRQSIYGCWDRNSIRRIIENLCINAVKYGYSLAPITLTTQQSANAVTISVHNNGPVLSPEEQSSMFQQFKRTQHATASGTKGWGLGLTTVKALAESHGGFVSVTSSEDEGTIFTITLPIHPSDFSESANAGA